MAEEKQKRPKSLITKAMIVNAKLLSSKAYTMPMIANALGIAYTTCFSNKELNKAIKEGQAESKQKVVDDLMARSEADTSSSASIFLAKSLKVFDNPFTTSTPKSITETIDRLGSIYKAVASGELEGEKGDRLVSYLEKMVKGFELQEIEKRIANLEAIASGK